jgi:hypothetical protein
VLLVVTVAAFLKASLQTPVGAPIIDGGRYFISSRTRETRMFAGAVALFATVAVLYLSQTMNRSTASGDALPAH